MSRNSKKGLLAVLAILFLLLSVALLSEAIDSIGSVPSLGLNLGQSKLEQNVTKLPETVEFTENCDIEKFLNETEGSPDLSISGIPGTSYLRAVVFERFEEGKWTAPPSLVAQYTGEYLPPGVQAFTSRDYGRIVITPLKEMTGYIPAVLHWETLVSTAHLTYDEELRVFYSSSTFTSSYELSYCVYQYDINLLESAQTFDDPKNLQIPDRDFDWLREIAEEVTRNSTSNYRKILSLISYLKENYTYNLEYEPAPPGVNPVEWFLLANKEGVCTHFNSALVLLARSIGLPSRLAGGYLINSQVEEQEVYPIQRHAFAEFHFEDLGWIIFDATPSSDCSECESAGPEENGVDGDEFEIEPVDEVFNETECQDCVNNYTKMSPEGGMPPNTPLFEIYGATGSGYLRTMVGEYYDGLWEMNEPASIEYIGELLPYHISGTRTSSSFTITPLTEMGGYIPTVKYTDTLSLDSHIQFYPDQLIFFSSKIFEDSYTVTSSYYAFTDEALRAAEPVNDERYLNVPEELRSILRELALRETSDADTPYEKYEALGSFLRSNYEYDVNYTRAPTGIDPVEWFLFHEKRGVCANFNSAFVLLARSIGLPARLVGGYAIDAGSNWQVVNASQAHAYTEAPFDNLGWITFDATGSGNETEENGVDGDEFEIEPVDEVFNETECQDCVNNCTKYSAEGGLPPKVDLFYIFGATGTGYLRTGVGEYYDGIWEMVDPAPETFHGGVLGYSVSGFSEETKYRFMVAPLVEMGGFIPVAQYTNELVLDSRVQWYADQQLFFSNDVFSSSYLVAHNEYNFSYQSLEAASLWEDFRYLNVPHNLFSKLRTLAQNVTSEYDSPFLKIIALRDYLSSEYEYDVNYTRAPVGIDPVEWFLFHEKRGVCANFNSAFVLLARSIGLPARYVVGYSIQPNVETQTVTSIQAHGYAEFPFMDLGWVIFDATGPGWFPFEEEPEVPPLLETVTEITEQDEIGVKGLDFGVKGSVVDENGDPVDDLRTLVYLKETKDENGLLCGEGPVVDGWFNINCNLPMNLTNGYYLIQAHTLGNHKYNGSWSDPPLKVVTQSELTLEAPEKVITGRAFMLQGNLSEYFSGLPISNQFCTIESVGETLISETNINGFYNETWVLHEPGNISLRVDWFGAEFFLGSNASSLVRSVPLSITPFAIEMMIRQESVMITGRVHAEELSGDNEEVILTLDDEAIGSVTTDENGFFSYIYTIPKDQELGEVMIGYSLVNGSSHVTQTEPVYARTYLQFTTSSILELNKDYFLKANLTDNLGLPLNFVNLTVVNREENENSTLLTDKEGVIEVPLRIDDIPDYDSISYNVSFSGIGYYLETYNEVVVPIDISSKQEEEVQQTDSNSFRKRALILVAVGFVGLVAYAYLIKRRKQKVDELGDAEELEPLVDLSPGIYSLEGLLEVSFPQIATSFPMVWGVKEEFIVQLHPVGNLETYGGKLDVTIIVDDEESHSITIFSDKNVDYPIVFNRKGYQHLKVVYKGQESQGIACDIVVKVVEYREEVNDLFNNEFEAYRHMREEIKNHFTAREFMRSILEGKPERYYSPLNEMVSVFELADYSLHEVRRIEYERFYRAKQEFGEIKIGN